MDKRFLALLFVAACSHSMTAKPVPLDDNQIIGVIDALNAGQLAAAQIAQTKATTSQIKALAAALVSAQSQNTQQESTLGISAQQSSISDQVDQLNLETTTQLNAQSTAPANTGPNTNGSVCVSQTASFDCLYAQAQVALQTKAVTELDSELIPQVKDAQLASLLQAMRLSLETQLSSATPLAANPNVGGTDGGGGQTGSTGSSSGASSGSSAGTSSGSSSGTSSGSSSGASSGASSGTSAGDGSSSGTSSGL